MLMHEYYYKLINTGNEETLNIGERFNATQKEEDPNCPDNCLITLFAAVGEGINLCAELNGPITKDTNSYITVGIVAVCPTREEMPILHGTLEPKVHTTYPDGKCDYVITYKMICSDSTGKLHNLVFDLVPEDCF